MKKDSGKNVMKKVSEYILGADPKKRFIRFIFGTFMFEVQLLKEAGFCGLRLEMLYKLSCLKNH